MIEVVDLFPTPLGIYSNVLDDCDIEKIKDDLEPLYERRDTSQFDQTAGNLNSLPEFSVLRDKIVQAAQDFYSNILSFEGELQMTQMWGNRYKENEFIHPHYHPNSFISGVYYIETGNSPLVFENPRPYTTMSIWPPYKYLNSYTASNNTWNVQPNTAYFFPSTLRHQSASGDTRISISFNLIPNVLGRPEGLNHTIVKGS